MAKLERRKNTRLPGVNYNEVGIICITICTKNRACLLSRLIENEVEGDPVVELLPHGKIAEKYIKQLDEFYDEISVENYVIMPNHIHMMLYVKVDKNGSENVSIFTIQNSIVSKFLSTFKRFCNKEYGENIWQYRSHDHVIRNREDYEAHMKYIYENPSRWYYDELYKKE